MSSHHKIHLPEGLHVIAYHAMLDVPRELAEYVSRLLHAERRRRGTRTRTRALTCFRQAVLDVRWFRHNVDVTALARDHGVSRATGYRYLDEVITVLAEQAPDLHDALRRAKNEGMTHVILDGKIFSADRCSEKTTSQCHRRADRSVVLRQSPRAPRQYPGAVGADRVSRCGSRMSSPARSTT